jgi:hypothetical protein
VAAAIKRRCTPSAAFSFSTQLNLHVQRLTHFFVSQQTDRQSDDVRYGSLILYIHLRYVYSHAVAAKCLLRSNHSSLSGILKSTEKLKDDIESDKTFFVFTQVKLHLLHPLWICSTDWSFSWYKVSCKEKWHEVSEKWRIADLKIHKTIKILYQFENDTEFGSICF